MPDRKLICVWCLKFVQCIYIHLDVQKYTWTRTNTVLDYLAEKDIMMTMRRTFVDYCHLLVYIFYLFIYFIFYHKKLLKIFNLTSWLLRAMYIYVCSWSLITYIYTVIESPTYWLPLECLVNIFIFFSFGFFNPSNSWHHLLFRLQKRWGVFER